MNLKKSIIFLIVYLWTTLISTIILSITNPFNQNLLSPISDLVAPISYKLGFSSKPQKIIYGFLPYWNLKESPNFNYSLLTHTAYFGIDFEPDGTIKTIADDGFTEPGWHKLDSSEYNLIQRHTKNFGGKNILVLRGMTTSLIESIVNNPTNRQRAIDTALNITNQKKFDGINIDFEYVGTPDTTTKQNFSQFVIDLSSQLKSQNNNYEISIDVFADSATKNRIWDFANIIDSIDYVIIMAYDFYRASSPQAGPVAPLRGACSDTQSNTNCLDYDISQTIADFSKIIPTSKIILGVPYYGYEWRTSSDSFLSNTYSGTGSTATYKRVQQFLSENKPSFTTDNNSESSISNLKINWNDQTLSPWISYQENQRFYQIHYEDEISLALKYDLVNQSDIAGIAIWALGYDGSWPQLWTLIENKFTTK